MEDEMFSSEVYVQRRNRLVKIMPEEFLIIVPPSTSKPTSADGKYSYTPNMNLVYLTGVDQAGTWLVIHRRAGMDIREDLFIDAYDWVMVGNVYGMSQYADGGLMTTKPYVSGSNYILKMSNYPKLSTPRTPYKPCGFCAGRYTMA